MINVKCLQCNNEYDVNEQLFVNKSKVIGKCKCGNKITFILDESNEWKTQQLNSVITKPTKKQCNLEKIESTEIRNDGGIPVNDSQSIDNKINIDTSAVSNEHSSDNNEDVDKSENNIKRKINHKNNRYKVYFALLTSAILFYNNITLWAILLTFILPLLIIHPITSLQFKSEADEWRIFKHIFSVCVLSAIFFLLSESDTISNIALSIIIVSTFSVILYLSYFKTRTDHTNNRTGHDISSGVPVEFVDIMGNILSIQSKLLLLNFSIDNHRISNDNKQIAIDFIEHHKLYDTKIRFNEYAPSDELKRLFNVTRINFIFKYIFGLFHTLSYVINPGRLFGGDYYNPITNTVNIYSNNPAIILHELGHALDFNQRIYPGLYMLLRYIPIVSLYQEFRASQFAIEYFRDNHYYEEEIKAYKILYPAYSTYIFGAVVEYVPTPLIVSLFFPFVILGHIAGYVHSLLRNKQIDFNDNVIFSSDIDEQPINWYAIFAILPGFFIGLYVYQLIGAVIGAIVTYFCYQEYIKYKRNSNS